MRTVPNHATVTHMLCPPPPEPLHCSPAGREVHLGLASQWRHLGHSHFLPTQPPAPSCPRSQPASAAQAHQLEVGPHEGAKLRKSHIRWQCQDAQLRLALGRYQRLGHCALLLRRAAAGGSRHSRGGRGPGRGDGSVGRQGRADLPAILLMLLLLLLLWDVPAEQART